MKRVLLPILMFMGLALSVCAKEEALVYFTDANATGWACRDFIDRDAKTYRFDGDVEEECTMEMRNYKKNGNTETFDIYVKSGHEKGKKRGSISITTDPDLTVSKGKADLSKQKVTIKDGGVTYNYYFMTEKQSEKYNGKSAGSVKSTNPVDAAKEKGKGLLEKGKGLFKKKK